jgi:hypothetical protein
MSCSNYAQITAREPQVHLFQDYNCTGNHRVLPVGLTPDLNAGSRPHRNAASGLIVPPHMDVYATTHYWWDYVNKGWGEQTKYGPGVYPNLNAENISWNAQGGRRNRGWNDDFDGVKVVRRQSWDSWKDQCCKNQKGDSVCPPGFRYPNDSNCYNIMNGYCSSGANMWNNLCAQWNKVEEKKQAYCNTGPHFAEQRCKDWCMKKNADGTTNFGKCDIGARHYCGPDGSPSDKVCSCLNSNVSKYNPACVDQNCATHGYLTSSQSALTCPNIVDCSVIMELESGGTTTVGDLKQNCRADTTVNVPGQPQRPQQAAPTQGFSTANKIIVLLLIVLIFVIVLAMIIGFSYLGGNSEKGNS